MLTAIGAGAMVAATVAFLVDELNVIQSDTTRLYTQAGVSVGLVLVAAIVAWRLLNRPALVDFMIATEGEMKKVNWPSRREIVGSTIVVIVGTFLLSAILFLINMLFSWIFQQINILESAS